MSPLFFRADEIFFVGASEYTDLVSDSEYSDIASKHNDFVYFGVVGGSETLSEADSPPVSELSSLFKFGDIFSFSATL